MEDSATIAAQMEVQQARACNYGGKSKAKRALGAANAQLAKASHIDKILDAPKIKDNFPTLLDLTIVDGQLASPSD